MLKYQIINNVDCLDKFQTVDEGIENRIIKYINMVNSKEKLILKVKSKRYTYNKINRMFNSIIESSCIVFLFQLAYVIIGISES